MKFFFGLNGLGRKWKITIISAVAVLLAVIIIAVVFSSCRGKHYREVVFSGGYSQKDLEGVPEIRVRLYHDPVKSVDISTTEPWSVLIDGKEVAWGGIGMPITQCWYMDGKWNMGMLWHDGNVLTIESRGGYIGVNGLTYRGKIVLTPADQYSFWVQNYVDLESYLFSVVSKELYPDFLEDAFRAQAVAARTFAMYESQSRGKNREYDVWASQRSQVYGGVQAESERGCQAVMATRGMVLKYGGPGKEKLFLSQFSACNGGYVNGADVIRPLTDDEKIPPLAGGQIDNYGKSCPVYKWNPVRVSKQDIFKALAGQYRRIRELGGLKEIQIRSQTSYGRPIWLLVVGTNGKSVPVRAEDLQICLRRMELPQAKDLMSMNCKMRDLGSEIEFYDGKGFGHGVGLSQWGANDRAKDGIDYRRILEFYYPKAVIVKEY